MNLKQWCEWSDDQAFNQWIEEGNDPNEFVHIVPSDEDLFHMYMKIDNEQDLADFDDFLHENLSGLPGDIRSRAFLIYHVAAYLTLHSLKAS